MKSIVILIALCAVMVGITSAAAQPDLTVHEPAREQAVKHGIGWNILPAPKPVTPAPPPSCWDIDSILCGTFLNCC